MLKVALSLFLSESKNGLASIYSKAKHLSPNKFSSRRCYSNAECKCKMLIKVLPALQDNLMYIIVDEETNEAAVVDPIYPNLLLNVVEKFKYKLTKVFVTHHHWDHAGGNKQLKCLLPELNIFGIDDRIEGLTCKISHGSIIKVGNLDVTCLHTPCHTSGHISYYVTRDGYDPAVFTGDTLFVGGCGKFFEGTAEQMYNNLIEIFGNLPDETQVYCGHEYTIANLKFAMHAEPCNQLIKDKFEWACKQREKYLHTVPSTIASEKLTNPFMRVCEPAIQEFTKECDPVKVMACLRERKNCFTC